MNDCIDMGKITWLVMDLLRDCWFLSFVLTKIVDCVVWFVSIRRENVFLPESKPLFRIFWKETACALCYLCDPPRNWDGLVGLTSTYSFCAAHMYHKGGEYHLWVNAGCYYVLTLQLGFVIRENYAFFVFVKKYDAYFLVYYSLTYSTARL